MRAASPWCVVAAVLAVASACAADASVVAEPLAATVTPAPEGPASEPADQDRVGDSTDLDASDDDEPATPPPSLPATPGAVLGFPLTTTEFGGVLTTTGIPLEVLAAADGDLVVRTPCGDAVIIAPATPIRDVQVVIDPGHGGPVDTGAVGPNGLVERDLNLTLSFAVEDELVARGVSVALTRTADYHTLLATRASFADALGARVLVSIHHNAPAAAPSDVPGTEVFVQSGSDASARLGGLLYEEVMAGLSEVDGVAWTRAADAGVLRVLDTGGRDAYGMIRRPTTPTALVELGYLAASSEADFMATADYIDLASVAVANAIERYLDTDDPGTGFVDEPRVFDPARAPGADVCTDPVLE